MLRDHSLAPERVDAPFTEGGRYLAVDPDWTPTLPAHADGFRLRDILLPA